MKYNHSFVPSLLRKQCRALLYHFFLHRILLESCAVEPNRVDYISVSCIYGFYDTRICISNYINNVHFIEYSSIWRRARLHSQQVLFRVVARHREMSVPEVCGVKGAGCGVRGAGCYTVSTYIQHAHQGIKVI